jgi:hypothetical protein
VNLRESARHLLFVADQGSDEKKNAQKYAHKEGAEKR